MKNHICKYCQYWFAYPKANGECRRHAPAPMYSMTGDKPGPIWWPQTAPDFWCGDYEYGPSPQEKKPEDILEMSIDELDLSVRAHNALNNDYCTTVGDVVKRSRGDLLSAEFRQGVIERCRGGPGTAWSETVGGIAVRNPSPDVGAKKYLKKN